MQEITQLTFLFIQIFFMAIFLSMSGFLFRKCFIDFNHKSHLEEDGLFGFILIGLLSLTLNFFLPLTPLVNIIFFLVIILIGINFNFLKEINKNFLFKTLIISSISLILIAYSTVYRPDAWLYHLPYSKIINEHKIILGAANIHERFSHISIFQYISSFFYNYIFLKNGILIPISLVASYFFFFAYSEFKKSLLKKNFIYANVQFLILVISLYALNRYSEYGNDAQVHFYYFVFIIFLFKFFKKSDENIIKELFFLSLFIFLMKPTFIFVSLIPFILFLKFKKKKQLIKSYSFLIYSTFLILWLLKNLLISGCLVYPLNFTCNDKIIWKPKNLNENIVINEAWSKGWPDLDSKKNTNYLEFNKDFNWLQTWSNNHLLFVVKKLIPVLFFILFNYLLLYFTKSLKKSPVDKNFIYLLLFSMFFFIIWLLKFPVYRFGISIIYVLFILLSYLLFIKNIYQTKINLFGNYLNYTIIFIFILVLSKNFLRINENLNNPPIPQLYVSIYEKDKLKKVYNSDKIFTHYKTISGKVCGYSISPCTHLDKELKKFKYWKYNVYLQD